MPGIKQPSEVVRITEFQCSEKRTLVRPRTVTERGPQLSLAAPETQLREHRL